MEHRKFESIAVNGGVTFAGDSVRGDGRIDNLSLGCAAVAISRLRREETGVNVISLTMRAFLGQTTSDAIEIHSYQPFDTLDCCSRRIIVSLSVPFGMRPRCNHDPEFIVSALDAYAQQRGK